MIHKFRCFFPVFLSNLMFLRRVVPLFFQTAEQRPWSWVQDPWYESCEFSRELSLVLICRWPTWYVACGMAWDNAAAYVNIYRQPIICPRHWSPACLRSWTQLNFAVKPVVNAWYRLCVGDKFSRMPQLSQAVPAAMPRLGRRQMRTRLNSAGSYGGEGEKMGRVPRGVARKSTSKGLRYRYLLSVFQIDKDFIFLRVICKRRKRRE